MNLPTTQTGTTTSAMPGLARSARAFDLTLSGRCIPGGRAGQPVAGDFFDTCVLDDHRFLIAVGDVAGHGLGAGSRMRQLRAAVRRVARWTSSPAELLSVLDETYLLGDEDDIATAWIGIYDSDTSLLHYASAGHPPPILTEVDSRPRLLAVASAPPLGTGAVAAHARGHTVLWQPGALLVAYSDGLVERPERDLEDQIHRLRDLVGHTQAALAPHAPTHALTDSLLAAVVPDPAATLDDVCILVLRRAAHAAPDASGYGPRPSAPAVIGAQR